MNHSPFKFLEAYSAQDKHLFFGRDQEIETLFNLTFRSRFILVYGPSGTGKTSLIRSGLAKRLSDTDWFSLYIRRKQDINAALREELSKWDKRPDIRPISEQVRYISLLYLRPVYLLFDQLEELFISGDAQEQYEFLQTLIELYQSDVPCKIILSMREEYLAQLYSFEEALPTLFDYRLRVEQMGDERIREVIIQTFNALPQVKLENPGTDADAIVENLKEPNKLIQLPYLQVYLDRLWNSAAEKQKPKTDDEIVSINKATIDEVGRIDEVLEDYVEEQIAKVQAEIPELQDRPSYVHKLLDNFVTSNGTRKNVNLNDFPNDGDKPLLIKALKELEYRRILLEDNGSYEFFHDSLAGVIFRKRSSEQKRLYNLIRRLKQAFSDYESNANNPDFFLNKLSSQEFRVNETDVREELTDDEFQSISAFVTKGEQFRESERISKEIEKRKRKRVLINLSILLAVVVGFGSLAILQWQKSLVSNLVSLSSNLILKSNPEDALSLAWQAHRILPNSLTERALLNAFNEYDSPEQWAEVLTQDLRVKAGDTLQFIRVAADDQSILALRTKTVTVWHPSGKLLAGLSSPKGFKFADVSPDSQSILTVSNDSLTQLWDINGKEISTLSLTYPAKNAFFLPSINPLLLALSNSDEITTWTMKGKPLDKFRHGFPVVQLFFSSNGERIFTVSANGVLKIWTQYGELIKTIIFPTFPSKIICSSTNDSNPAYNYCAAIVQDNVVQVWSIDRAKSPVTIKLSASKLLDIAFESDGKTLSTIENDFTISRWTVDGHLVSRNKFDFSNPDCRFSPDAHWLVNEIKDASETGTPSQLWNSKGEAVKALFSDDSRWGFSPSSKLLAAVEVNNHRLRIWERRDRLRGTLAGHFDAVYKSSFSADSLYLFTASADASIQIWDFNNRKSLAQTTYNGVVRDIATPRADTWLVCFENIAQLQNKNGETINLKHLGDVHSGELSSDGKFALTASEDHTAILWDQAGQKVHVFQHGKGVNRATFSPDGQYILTACHDDTARLWSRKTYELLQVFAHTSSVSYAAFSPNFKNPLIVTTSADSTAKLWDLNGDKWLELAHNDFVSCAAVSKDNSTILTTTNSGIAQLWDRNGEVKGVFETKSPIYHATFSPNEQSVVLSCENGDVQLWPTLQSIEHWAGGDTLNNNHTLRKHHIKDVKEKYRVADTVWDDFFYFLKDAYQKSTLKVNNWYHQLKRILNV